MKQQKNNGFSLVELMVAGAIFVLVLGFVGGTFSLFVGKQKQQLSQQLLQQEVQNFLEVIERDVRTAYGETFNPPDPASNSSISFMNQEQKMVVPSTDRVEHLYFLETDTSENDIQRIYYDDGTGGVVIPITSNKIDIKNLEFKWNQGQTNTDSTGKKFLTGVHLRLTIALEVCVKEDPTVCLQTQTTIANRQTNPIDEN